MSGPLPRSINTLPQATEAQDADEMILRVDLGGGDWQDMNITIEALKEAFAGNLTLTTQDGVISDDDISLFGEYSSSAHVMETYVDGGIAYIENRTWETAYIVDQNATPGDRGTFTTLQDAIDAIALDGVATNGKMGLIRMRQGKYTYVDPITIPDGIALMIQGYCFNGPNGNLQDFAVWLDATIDCGNAFALVLSNMFVYPENGDPAILLTGNTQININNSYLGQITQDAGNIISNQSTLSILQNNGLSSFFNCVSVFVQIDQGSSVFNNCNGVNIIETGATSGIAVINCSDVNYSGTTTGPSSLSLINSNLSSQVANSGSIQFVTTASDYNNGLAQNYFYAPGSLIQKMRTIKSNVFVARVVTASGDVNRYDHFIGVKGNVAPVTLNLLTGNINGPMPWQEFIIADLEGTAGTNPITLLPAAGLINGQASFALNEDYAAVKVIWDGTNWFVIQEAGLATDIFSSLIINGLTVMNGAQAIKVTNIATDYNVLATDYAIGVTNTSAPRSIVLPVAGLNAHQCFEVKDKSGNATVNNITITVAGGALIDGVSSILINQNYQGWSFVFDGTNYWTR